MQSRASRRHLKSAVGVFSVCEMCAEFACRVSFCDFLFYRCILHHRAIIPILGHRSEVPKTAGPAAFGAHRGIQIDRPMGQTACRSGYLPTVSPVFRQAWRRNLGRGWAHLRTRVSGDVTERLLLRAALSSAHIRTPLGPTREADLTGPLK